MRRVDGCAHEGVESISGGKVAQGPTWLLREGRQQIINWA